MPTKQASPKAKSDNVFGQARRSTKCFESASTPVYPPTINRPSPCRAGRCGNTQPGGVGPLRCRFVTLAPGRPDGKPGRNCWTPPAAGKSMWCWCGGWTGGRSVTDLLATLQELEHLGVGFVSLTEALDLTTPAGRAMAAMLAVFAAFEREILQERTNSGRPGSSSAERQKAGPSCNRRHPRGGNPETTLRRCQQIRDRSSGTGWSHLRAPDSGLTYFPEKSRPQLPYAASPKGHGGINARYVQERSR